MSTSTTLARRAFAALLGASPLLVLGIIALLSGKIPDRVRYDQVLYHEPTIREFLKQWPRFDLYDYLSATTPAYHLLLAGLARAAGESLLVLRLGSLAIGSAFVGLVAWGLAGRVRPVVAGLLVWPLATSLYVGQSAAYILPDNMAWLLVSAMVLLALRERPRWGTFVLMGGVLVLLVATRQVHAWTGGLIVVSAWLAPISSTERYVGPALLVDLRSRIIPLMIGFAAGLPAALLLARFVHLWGGLVPPRFQGQYAGGFNAASVCFFLSLLALGSVFFAPILWPRLLRMWQERRGALIVAAISGALSAVIAPSNYDYAAGRRSGLWNLAAKLPTIGHTSPLMLLLAAAGAGCLAAWVWPLRARDKLVVLASIAGFWVALGASVELWQRYTEPFLLVMLAVMGALTIERETEDESRFPSGWTRWWALTGPVALAGLFALLGVRSLAGAPLLTDPPPPAKAPDDTSPIPAPVDVSVPPPAHGRTLW
ncbi:MAG: hypothetical protein ACOYN0_00755 [Phycisphaerales bacterium]